MGIREIVDDAKTDLLSWAEDHADADDSEADDQIWEIADSATPIATYEIFEVGVEIDAEYMSARDVDGDSDTPVIDIFKRAIYEHIRTKLSEYWQDELEDLPRCSECRGRCFNDTEVECGNCETLFCRDCAPKCVHACEMCEMTVCDNCNEAEGSGYLCSDHKEDEPETDEE